jgi:hypothetical protein
MVILLDSFLLVVQAKIGWPESSVSQALAEAGCLFKTRLTAGKETPVFAVLNIGLDYRFFVLTLIILCILVKNTFLKLEMKELKNQVPIYLKLFVGLLGLWLQFNFFNVSEAIVCSISQNSLHKSLQFYK